MSPDLLLSRRALLQGTCGGLALALLPALPRPARAYQTIEVPTPARLSGIVRYAGRAAPPRKVTFSGDCAHCRRYDIREESLLVSPHGGLRNVVVILEGAREGRAPSTAVPTLAEKQCTFVPHVLSITLGSQVLLHNQDPVLNTFHAIAQPAGRTLFNIGMPRKDQKLLRRIREPGVIQMRCDVHPWEEGYIFAVDHPYHTVTDAQGAFVLEQIPPGRYQLALWHERLGSRRQAVELKPGAQLQLTITYPSAR